MASTALSLGNPFGTPLLATKLRPPRLRPELVARPDLLGMIAGSIYMSHNTIKTQVQSIYRKLGVSDRQEAVARSRTLGLP